MSLLLDTTVLIDALRGRAAAERLRRLRAAGEVPWICAVNVEEVVRGLLPGEEGATARMLGAFRLAPLGYAEGERAGHWRRDQAARGRTVAQADCLIAAAAVGVDARLATGNPKDFAGLDGLDVEHWHAGR